MVESFKEELRECNNPIAKPEKLEVMSHAEMMNMVQASTKGSLNDDQQRLMQSPYYRTWLAKLQEKNPFIGSKYIMAAPEYSTEQKEAEPVTEKTLPGKVVNSEGVDIVVGDTASAEADVQVVMDKNDEEQEGDEVLNPRIERIMKYQMDYFIIANARQKLAFDAPMNDILDAIDFALKEYHYDENYKCEVDISQALQDIESKTFKMLEFKQGGKK